ncbi:MAG: hypothetical protein DVB26_09035, partial [Verrucomicrobia bacterium]
MSALDQPPREMGGPRQEAAHKNQERPQSIASSPAGKRSFAPEVLESLRSSLPEYLAKIGVELRKNGSRLVGKCPMHDDSDPSFALFGDGHQTCGCFPCGHTGDVFATSQWLGRAGSFTEAVREVGAVLGVHLPDQTAGPATRTTAAPQRAAKPELPFELSDADREKRNESNLSWKKAFEDRD